MALWVYVLIVAAVAVLDADWLIVMGINKRRWKGGRRE